MKEKIKFYIDKPQSEKPTYIFLRYPCKDGYLRYSTKQSILPSDWNDQLQMTNDRMVNVELDKHYQAILQYLEHCRIMKKTIIYRQDLINELNEKLNRQKRSSVGKSNHFFESLDKIIDLAESGELVIPRQGHKYTAGVIKNFRKTRNRLFDFNPNLDFSKIDLNIYYSFISWCNGKEYTKNYTGSLIKEWKTLMGLAYEKGYHKNLIYSHPQFKKLEEESQQVYLNDEEILQLYKYNLSATPHLETIRDRFVINLFNGLRISDHKKLDLDKFYNGLITDINKKTTKKVVIPIHPIIEEIIKKYGGKLPKQHHENVVNREIKEICKAAKLNEPFHFTKTVGGVKRHFTKKKWEMITNHTARRSLTTNLLKHTDMQSVMPVTGMSLKTLQKYNKRTPEENAEMLKQNSYFRSK